MNNFVYNLFFSSTYSHTYIGTFVFQSQIITYFILSYPIKINRIFWGAIYLVPKYSSYNLHDCDCDLFWDEILILAPLYLTEFIYTVQMRVWGCNWSLMSTKKKYNPIIECLVSENPFLKAFIIVQCSAFNCCVKPWSPRPTTPGHNYWKIKWY